MIYSSKWGSKHSFNVIVYPKDAVQIFISLIISFLKSKSPSKIRYSIHCHISLMFFNLDQVPWSFVFHGHNILEACSLVTVYCVETTTEVILGSSQCIDCIRRNMIFICAFSVPLLCHQQVDPHRSQIPTQRKGKSQLSLSRIC